MQTRPTTGKEWTTAFSPLRWTDGRLELLDQRALPTDEIWHSYEHAETLAEAIRTMVVRGAPAIGCAAALGLAAAAHHYPVHVAGFSAALSRDIDLLADTRPTAVNLRWALEQQRGVANRVLAAEGICAARAALVSGGLQIWKEDIRACRAIGRRGAELIPDGAGVLTHCNAGALATGGYGTALGVIRAAIASGKRLRVFADETRPLLQGARLTAWELMKSGIETTLICDNSAGALMRRGEITHCIVGADRIARNGDVANKIGTYGVAILAHYHRIPFLVAAPESTIDSSAATGDEIPIEERDRQEVTHIGGRQLAPRESAVRNLAFDIAPAHLVTAIITQSAVFNAPYAF